MAKVNAKAGALVATALVGVFGAMTVTIDSLMIDEGYVDRKYFDIAKVATACGGVTGPGVVADKVYSPEECKALTAQAYLKISLEVARCLPGTLPADTRGAFQRIGYNIGSAGFCASSMSRLALAGDLPGACAAISKYIYSRHVKDALGRPRPIAGLIERRKRERAQCEAGLAATPLRPEMLR